MFFATKFLMNSLKYTVAVIGFIRRRLIVVFLFFHYLQFAYVYASCKECLWLRENEYFSTIIFAVQILSYHQNFIFPLKLEVWCNVYNCNILVFLRFLCVFNENSRIRILHHTHITYTVDCHCNGKRLTWQSCTRRIQLIYMVAFLHNVHI